EPSEPREYTVQPGDTLWDIAERELGDPFRWPEIYKLNRGKVQPSGGTLTDPDLIQPGWVLRIPERKPQRTSQQPRTPEQAQQERSGQPPQQRQQPTQQRPDKPAKQSGEPKKEGRFTPVGLVVVETT